MAKNIDVSLPDSLVPYERDIRLFFDLMVRKLDVNRAKGWVTASNDRMITSLVQSMDDEVTEMKEAIRNEPQFSVMLEAVDVANIGLLVGAMCLSKTKEEYRELQALYLRNMKEPK